MILIVKSQKEEKRFCEHLSTDSNQKTMNPKVPTLCVILEHTSKFQV